jgi:hypothetical protein
MLELMSLSAGRRTRIRANLEEGALLEKCSGWLPSAHAGFWEPCTDHHLPASCFFWFQQFLFQEFIMRTKIKQVSVHMFSFCL